MDTGHLTVNNITKTLAPVVDQWIKVAGVLDVPQTVIENVLVSRLSDKSSLQRVVEWWFKNTPNPEWTTIETTLKGNLDKQVSLYHCNEFYLKFITASRVKILCINFKVF